MQRKDYQDALNELQLSDEFCSKMTQKLSQTYEEDDYEEVENHVEVIEHKKSHSFIAAAAAIVLIGGGIGGYFGFKDDIKKTFSNTSTEVEDVTNENADTAWNDEDFERPFDFPFGTLNLRGKLFTYSYNNINASYCTTGEQAEQLIKLFSEIDWSDETVSEEDSSNYNAIYSSVVSPAITNAQDYSLIRLDCTDEMCEIEGENDPAIYYYLVFDNKGDITLYKETNYITSDDINDIYWHNDKKTYHMTSEQYARMLDILFYDETHAPFSFLGIKSELTDAEYMIENRMTGFMIDSNMSAFKKFSAEQAFEIAPIFNKLKFEYADFDDIEKDDSAKPVLTFRFFDNETEYNMFWHSNDTIELVKISEDSNERSSEYYKLDGSIDYSVKSGEHVYDSLFEIANNGSIEACPIDLSHDDSIFIRATQNGKYTGFKVEGSEIQELAKVMSDMEWIKPHFEEETYNYLPKKNDIHIDGKDFSLSVSENGEIMCQDSKVTYFIDRYTTNDFDKLNDYLNGLKNRLTPLSDDELADNSLTNDLKGYYTEIGLTTDMNAFNYNNNSEDINKAVELLIAQEWEQQTVLTDPIFYLFLYRAYGTNHYEAFFSDDLNTSNDDSSEKTLYYFSNNNVMYCLNRDGLLYDVSTGCTFKCKDPEGLISQLGEILKTS